MSLCLLALSCLGASGAIFDLDEKPGKNCTVAQFRLWTPDGSEPLKGLFILLAGWNGDGRGMANHSKWQECAQRVGFGIIGCHFKSANTQTRYDLPENGSGQILLQAIKTFGEQSKHPEMEFLPLALYGFSAGGQFSCQFACWKPLQVIAFVAVKGGVYILNPGASVDRIPAIFFAGAKDTEVRQKNIKKIFEQERGANALWCHVLEANTGHDAGRSADLARPFFEAIIKMRVPSRSPGRSGPVNLQPANESHGWACDLKTFEIMPAGSFRKPKRDSAWLPDETCAKIWQALVKGDASLPENGGSPATASTSSPQPPPASTAPGAPSAPAIAAPPSYPQKAVCAKAVDAFDPANPSKQLGQFMAGSELIIEGKDDASGMLRATFKQPNGGEIRALCRPGDLGQ
ncbi:MAG: hypothetical protein PHV34_20790 [Verrucomicrobiae bacterium]|nr:hypothetical protein [Verrucomicrobiae bacterium]